MKHHFSRYLISKSLLILSLLLPVAFLGNAHATHQIELPPHPAQQVVAQFHQALKAGNSEAALALLASDVKVFEGGNIESSRAQYQQHHLAADMNFMQAMAVTIVAQHVRGDSNFAVAMTQSELTGVVKGEKRSLVNLETMTLERIDDQWLITHIHWSH